jgi:hypothetical protein
MKLSLVDNAQQNLPPYKTGLVCNSQNSEYGYRQIRYRCHRDKYRQHGNYFNNRKALSIWHLGLSSLNNKLTPKLLEFNARYSSN